MCVMEPPFAFHTSALVFVGLLLRCACLCVCRYAYAIYCIIMVAVFVVGMPAGILYALSRHRFTLFGPASQSTRKRLGFLYHM